eukprot:4536300-Amphidinium_carterae.1
MAFVGLQKVLALAIWFACPNWQGCYNVFIKKFHFLARLRPTKALNTGTRMVTKLEVIYSVHQRYATITPGATLQASNRDR